MGKLGLVWKWVRRVLLGIAAMVAALVLLVLVYLTITTPNLITLGYYIKGADKVVVRSGGMCHRNAKREKVLFTLTDEQAIRELWDGIKLEGGQFGKISMCMCCGNPTFEFYRGKKLLTSVSFHHSYNLRWAGWSSDAHLSVESSKYFKELFQKQGLTEADYR